MSDSPSEPLTGDTDAPDPSRALRHEAPAASETEDASLEDAPVGDDAGAPRPAASEEDALAADFGAEEGGPAR